ncbi:MAG: hypothetical protein ACE5JP_12855 [Candidatus Bipolaricaulia bacterium]
MNQYTELYAWIRHSFNGTSFSIDDFRSVFPTSQAPKVVYDLIKQGYLQRVNRGIYRAVEPDQLIEIIVQRSSEHREVLKRAERKYAYCDSTAVTVWTDGYYWTGFTKGFKPIHIKVLKDDLPYWKKFFDKQRMRTALPDENKTLFGFVHILHPDEDFEVIDKKGTKVIPLDEVANFCLERESVYQPALEYLDEAYSIGYKKREFVNT